MISSERGFRNGITRQKQEQQMIDAVEDVEEALDDEQPHRLRPPRVEMDDAGIVVERQRALGAVRRDEAQDRQDLDAEPPEARMDREP